MVNRDKRIEKSSNMKTLYSINELPTVPAVYAMFGGKGRGLYCAYVGIGGNLKQRINQHLIRRDSSVSTGTSAVVLNPDYITEVHWWEHENFADRILLEAAELIAFDILNPVLRSRGAMQDQAIKMYLDHEFKEKMSSFMNDHLSGKLMILSLQDALLKIDDLEKRISELENKFITK